MANLLASCQGFRKSGLPRNREATRLGDGDVIARAQTWVTFARLQMKADGSGSIVVQRDGKAIINIEWEAE